MELTSTAFGEGETIPAKYTCDGENRSPALAWSGAPAGTQSFALLMEDPDAPRGTFTHWIAWGLAPSQNQLPEDARSIPMQGQNDFGKTGYGGPCPPPGPAHRYFFRLYALDRKPDLAAGAGRRQFLNAIQGHVLGEAEYMGRYARSGRR